MGGIIVILLVLRLTDAYSNRVWFCKKFGWHKEPIQKGFDGVSLNGTCPRCQKHVLHDSQGNWF